MNKANGIAWGSVLKPMPGETESGDQYLIKSFSNGLLIAAIDGLGHGDKAAVVAKKAVAALQNYEHEAVDWLITHVHKALRSTRGAVMSLASFDTQAKTLTWVGVGNVNGVLLRAHGKRETLMLRGGVVGYRLPKLYPITLPLSKGDTLVLGSDGLRSGFTNNLSIGQNPQKTAETIFEKHRRGTDDALIIVAQYMGQ